MKLTKSKISKLYNKTRQSLKRYKKRKSSYKKRTFRKRKINLARKSLKRFNYKTHKGGWGEVDTPKEELTNKSIDQPVVEMPYQSTTDQSFDETTYQPVAETPYQPTTEQSFDETPYQSFDETPYQSTTEQPFEETPYQPVAETPYQPTTDQPLAETPYQPTTDQPLAETPYQPTTDKPFEETPYQPTTDQHFDKSPYESVTQTTSEGIENIPTEELPVKNLEHVANYIADLVADKVSNISLGEKPQEGFQAINKAVETMSSSGGSIKTRKTRKFRLNNKNKSRHM